MSERRARWLLLGVVAVRLILSLIELATPTLWMDEASSLVVAWGLGGAETDGILTRLTRGENTPPLYFLALRAWGAVSMAEWWLRALSVLCGLGSLGALALLAWTRPADAGLDRGAGLIGLALFATATMHIDAAQAIRFYGMATLFAVVAAAAGERWLRERAWGWLGLYVVAATLGLATFYPSGFVLAGIGLRIAVALGLARAWRRLALWVGAALLVAALFAPLVPLLVAQSSKVAGAFWARPPELATAFFALYPIAGGRPLAMVYIALIAVALLRVPRLSVPLFSLFAIPWATQLLFGWLEVVPFHPKYLVAAAPPLYLVVGIGLTRLPRRWLRIGAAMVLTLLVGRRLVQYYPGDFERYYRMRDVGLAAALHNVAARRDPGEPVVHTSVYSYFPALYYLPAVTPQVIASPPLPHYLLGLAVDEARRWPDAGPARTHPRLWLVDHPSYNPGARDWFTQDGFAVANEWTWGEPRPRQQFDPIRTYELVANH